VRRGKGGKGRVVPFGPQTAKAIDRYIRARRTDKLRHTAAHRWLAAGGPEGGLMAVAGRTRPDMLMRYTKAQASARVADEARALNL
jgi:site-specific recombinase XerD